MSLINDEPAAVSPSDPKLSLASDSLALPIATSPRPTAVRYITLAWLTAAAALAYVCRPVGVAESAIRADLKLTEEQSGVYLSAFFWTYAIFQIPGGWFAERRGTRFALYVFATIWSVAMIATGIAPVFWLMIVAQLFLGVAQAGVLPATYSSIGIWMPLKERALSCGVLGAGMSIGAIAAGALAGRWIETLGWRLILVLFGIPGIIWAIGFWIWFRDRPSQVSSVNSSELALIGAGRAPATASPNTDQSEPLELLAIARSPVVWWLCGQQICRAAGVMFFLSWFPTFLQNTRGVSVEKSGYLQGAVLTGGLVGGILGGWVTDWIWKKTGNLRFSRSGIGAGALGICSVVILCAWFVQSTEAAVALLTFGLFIAAVSGPCTFAAAIDIGGARVPQVSGMINMSGNFAAAICPLVVGKLHENWNIILPLFAGVFLVGAICWLFVNPQRPIQS